MSKTPSLEARLWETPRYAAWAAVTAVDPPRRYIGQVGEVTVLGRTMLRIELVDGGRFGIVILSDGFVRDIQPCSERAARAEARLQPQPAPTLATAGGDDEPY